MPSSDDELTAPHSPDGTIARLRADIDRGRTGDKVDWPDPAAAPLGTDDEAAGTRLDASVVERAHAAENARGAGRPDRRLGATWILIVLIIAIAGAIGFLGWALA
jgi:hypothetical protein